MRAVLPALLLLAASPAAATITSITVEHPPNPLSARQTQVVVHGTTPDPCWTVGTGWLDYNGYDSDHECGYFSGAYTVTDAWTEGASCAALETPYAIVVYEGCPAAGAWTFTVTESRDSARDPGATTLSVTVTLPLPTPVESASWGRIKGLYR